MSKNDYNLKQTELNEKTINLTINKNEDFEKIIRLGKALGNKDCLKIFQIISEQPLSMSEISKLTDLPISSVSNHIDTLNAADLIHVYYQPSLKGHVKICNNKTTRVILGFLEKSSKEITKKTTYEMGVGMFTDCMVTAPCGMANLTENFVQDNPNKFFTPKKSEAELLWFSSGFVTYKFPNEIKNTETVKSLNLSLELCSETMYYRDKYPSDITFFVNDIELFTWTSPGDFGGRRGKYTPKSWPLTSTQFGLLKSFKIDSKGVTLDNILVNPNVNINDLNIQNNNVITLTIKIKEDAIHKGGINIFGKNFGDYNQSIILTVTSI